MKPTAACLKVYKRPHIYPDAWERQRIQKIMLKWAGNKCENCGATIEQSLLHVHHIYWNNKHDCRFENLVVVCVSCHIKIHNHKWQPGRPWTLTKTPEWMTARGYSNPVEERVEAVEENQSAINHINLGLALQQQAARMIQESGTVSIGVIPLLKLLKQSLSTLESGIRMEREGRNYLRGNIAEAIESEKRHIKLAALLQKKGAEVMQSIQFSQLDPAKLPKVVGDCTFLISASVRIELQSNESLIALEEKHE